MKVVSVNISEEKGTIKHPVPLLAVDSSGAAGDAHSGAWHRQISLLSMELIRGFEKEVGRSVKPGEFAENITTEGLDLRELAPLDRISIGQTEMEVTQIGKSCHGDTCAIFREVGKCVMPKEGIFCRVIRGGTVTPGDSIRHDPRELQIVIVTVSDRASRGEYEDLSGPAVLARLENLFEGKRWHPAIRSVVVPDEPDRLRNELQTARAEGTDIVFTTGGTGVGPRDHTPDIAREFIDREIPGIMEHIRTSFGRTNPNALLSRAVAGIMDHTIVYALPGSVRAVEEFMAEIAKTLEHLIVMVHGLGH